MYGRLLRGGLRTAVKRPLPSRVGPLQPSVDVTPHVSRCKPKGEFRFLSSSPSPRSSELKGHDDRFSGAIFSADQPPELPQRLPQLSNWTLLPSKKGISRQYTFSGFASAWRFMSLVAEECKAQRHHPSWHNLYNQVTIEWTTHKPEGLSMKDVEMAEFCDQTAEQIGLKKTSQ